MSAADAHLPARRGEGLDAPPLLQPHAGLTMVPPGASPRRWLAEGSAIPAGTWRARSSNESARLLTLFSPLRRLLRCAAVARLGAVAAATAISKLLTLASLAYAARVLGPESWGLVGAALAAVAYASVLLAPGLMTWGTREIARDRRRARSSLLIVNLTQLVMAGVAFCALAGFGLAFLDQPARAVLLLSAAALLAQAVSVDWVFDGIERAEVPVGLQLAVSALRLAAVVGLCRSAADVLLYAAILPGSLGLQALGGYVLLYRRGCFRPQWPGLARLRQGLRAAWPLGVTMALFLLAHNASTLLVQAFHGAHAAGQYLAALRLVEMASVLPGVLGTVFRPRLSRVCWADAALAARETRLYARAHLLAGWLLAPLTFAEAPRIIGCIYGEQYAAAAPLLRIFSLAVLANYLVCGSTNCLVAFGRDRVMLRAMALSGAVSMGAGLALTPGWGTAGAALAASLIHPVGWLAALGDYRRTVGALEWSRWRRPCGAAAAVAGGSWLLESQGVPAVWRIGCVAAVYVAIAGPCWVELQRDLAGQLTAAAAPASAAATAATTLGANATACGDSSHAHKVPQEARQGTGAAFGGKQSVACRDRAKRETC
jgi:O-antigen/teichoic acid export membrane protein